MEDYLQQNTRYCDRLYNTQHVESHVFRPFGRILARDFGLTGAAHERVLDFGCATGAALTFFQAKGFDIYGVDISQANIEACRQRLPDIADHFKVVDAMPSEADRFFGGAFDLVLALDSLYYYGNRYLGIRLRSLHQQMKPGGILYATMIGIQSTAYEVLSDMTDDGLNRVRAQSGGQEHFLNLTHSEDEVARKFAIFKRRHIGFHSYRFRDDEGTAFFYTFVGQKTDDATPL